MRESSPLPDDPKRPIDADLKFMAKALTILRRDLPPAAPVRTWWSEVRANFGFFLSVLVVLYLGWCIWDRFYGPLPTDVRRVQVETDHPLRVGDKVPVTFDLLRHRVCRRSFWYLFADSTGHRSRFQEPDMDAIGHLGIDSFAQDFQIPGDMRPGPAKLRIIWSWACPENIIEAFYPVPLVLKDIPFTIVPR